MTNRIRNYTAFYVREPLNQSNLEANATKDFVTYNQLRTWKELDSSFPFVDSHDKNYSVRHGSDWEATLKPRLRDRLNKSKKIILILSSITSSSGAFREQIDFGINNNGLPVIVIYPEYKEKSNICDARKVIRKEIENLWDRLQYSET